jgi:hypothetical protein
MKNTMKPSKLAKKANALKGFMNSMSKPKMKKGGSFPDLNKDGEVTKADILMGRGVIGKKKAEMGMSNPNAFLTKPKKPTNTMSSNKSSFAPNVAPSAGKVYNAPPKTTREMYDYATKKSASIPTRTMKKGGMKKGGMGMNIMDEAMDNATPSIPNSYYKMGGKKQANPLAAMIKKSKPKMAMGGDFFPQNPLMASKYKGDTLMGQSLKKGGMIKKKKK